MLSKLLLLMVIVVFVSASASPTTSANTCGLGTDCETQICPSCGEGEEELCELGKCCPVCVPAGCSEMECPLYKCLEGYTLARREGECCRTCTLDCKAVQCPLIRCGEGTSPVVLEGQCCPQCQRECTIKGQTFSSCASQCPRTCNPPKPPVFCPAVCVEGCACPSGQVIDTVNNRCVPEDECPPVAEYSLH